MSYADRPWLARYSPGVPGHIDTDHPTAAATFAAAVAAGPDDPFLHYFDTTLSFGEIDRAASALASELLADGFEPGDRLAVYVQNNPAFIIGLVAAWKAGGIAVAIYVAFLMSGVLGA